MKLPMILSALLATGFVAASTGEAGAVVYCRYIGYPAGCVERPGVVLRPRPGAQAVAPGVGVRPGTPMGTPMYPGGGPGGSMDRDGGGGGGGMGGGGGRY